MPTRPRSIRLLPVLLFSSLLAACVTTPDDAPQLTAGQPLSERSEHGLVEATISLDGAEIVRGANDLSITLHASQGSAEPELKHVEASMAAHGHSVSTAAISHDGDTFRANLDLFMSGRWQIALGVELEASSDVVEFALDVP